MLMDLEAYETAYDESDNESTYSYTNDQNARSSGEQAKAKESDLGDYLDPDRTLACQTKKADPFGVRSRPATSKRPEKEQPPNIPNNTNCPQCRDSKEQLFHVKYVRCIFKMLLNIFMCRYLQGSHVLCPIVRTLHTSVSGNNIETQGKHEEAAWCIRRDTI